jgi:hypothetical protein
MKKYLAFLALATGLTVSASNTITLGWDSSPPEQLIEEYLVFQKQPSDEAYSLIGSVSTNFITISNLSDGLYMFTVVAKNMRSESAPSEPFTLPAIATKVTNIYAVIHIELRTKLD